MHRIHDDYKEKKIAGRRNGCYLYIYIHGCYSRCNTYQNSSGHNFISFIAGVSFSGRRKKKPYLLYLRVHPSVLLQEVKTKGFHAALPLFQ